MVTQGNHLFQQLFHFGQSLKSVCVCVCVCGSKYDPILDKFLEGHNDLVAVEVAGRDGNYVRMQLKKRIEARGLKINVSVVNNTVYLEK